MGFSQKEFWSGLPFPPPGHLQDPGIEHNLLHLLHQQADSLSLNYLGSIHYFIFNWNNDFVVIYCSHVWMWVLDHKEGCVSLKITYIWHISGNSQRGLVWLISSSLFHCWGNWYSENVKFPWGPRGELWLQVWFSNHVSKPPAITSQWHTTTTTKPPFITDSLPFHYVNSIMSFFCIWLSTLFKAKAHKLTIWLALPLWLSDSSPTSPPPLIHPAIASLLLHQPCWKRRDLYLLFPLPRMFFLQISTWLSPALSSGHC